MSFDSTGTKPSLVENKMISRISKIQKIMDEQNITWSQKMGSNFWNFIINNVFSLIIIVFIAIILIYRYNEVKKRKKTTDKKETEDDTE